ncbi:hypothetical protein BKA69DRAFT_1125983 [Paraphysoderma sedebokerense]|nr:hypothetical protein BKA69DRAFT_1125983 [Paraphysoderma sedebokerense]
MTEPSDGSNSTTSKSSGEIYDQAYSSSLYKNPIVFVKSSSTLSSSEWRINDGDAITREKVTGEDVSAFYRETVGLNVGNESSKSRSTSKDIVDNACRDKVEGEYVILCPDCDVTFTESNIPDHIASIPHQLNRKGESSELKKLPVFGLGKDNKGFQIMQRAGWDYTGLGPSEEGRTQPVPTTFKLDRGGLGSKEGRNKRKITHSHEEIEKARQKKTKPVPGRLSRHDIEKAETEEKERGDRLRAYFGRYL